jgi:hypothetical protein
VEAALTAMKRSTLVVLALAAALASFVYFHEIKRAAPKDTTEDESKPAFSLQAQDITSLALTRAGQKMVFENHNGDWQVIQPVQTEADQSVLGGIATELSSSRVTRTLTAAPDRLSSYGLAPPQVTLELQLKNGTKHKLELGAKDFTGISAYGIVDGAKQVSLLPESLLVTADKPLDELRDRTVLHVLSSQVASIDLRNPSEELVVASNSGKWQIQKPRATPADSSTVDSLLASVSAAKMTKITSETPTELAKYGLTNPAVTLHLKLTGDKEATLVVGKKADNDYYARDTSRRMIFRINEDLYKKLNDKFFDFRDKSVYHFDSTQLSRIEIHNANTKETIICNQDKNGNWTLEQPDGLKGKSVDISKISVPFETTRAQEIYDVPPAAIAGRLAKPALEFTFTDKSGNKTTVLLSAASEGFVYARSSAGAAVLKLEKKILDDLNFKAASLTT